MALDFGKIKEIFNVGSFVKNEKGAVGIDIGSSSIKVIQLKKESDRAVLETYGELQLGPYGGVEIGRAMNLKTAKLTEALVDVVREASVTSKNGALAIPYAASFVTVITLPTVDDTQLASIVPIEARKYIPVPVSEVMLDWFVIPSTSNEAKAADQSKTKVLLAAIHNEAITKYKTVIHDATLLTGFTEIEIFSTIRSSVLRKDNVVMILDLGAATSKLYVVSKGIVERMHSITVGAQDITFALARALSIEVADAEELKRKEGLLGHDTDPRIKESMLTSLDRIFGEAKRVLEQHEAKHNVQVSKIILTGGGGVLCGLKEYAQGMFKHEVTLADPFSKVEYPAFLDQTLKEAGPSFAVAMGVAIRRLNEP